VDHHHPTRYKVTARHHTTPVAIRIVDSQEEALALARRFEAANTTAEVEEVVSPGEATQTDLTREPVVAERQQARP